MMRNLVLVFILEISNISAFAKEAVSSSKLTSFLPNTVALELSENQTTIELRDRPTLKTKKSAVPGLLGEGGRLLDNLTITTLDPPERDDYVFGFRWVPAFTLAFYNMDITSNAALLSQTDFQLFRVSLGIGPELNFYMPFGTLYLGVAPGIAYSWLTWSSPVSGGSIGRSGVNAAATVGLYKYIGNHWSIRIFFKQILEDNHAWKAALDSSQGFEVPVKTVFNTIYGLSVGYSF